MSSDDTTGEIFAAGEQAWVANCLPGLRALLLRLTRNVDLANDLTQDVLTSVLLAFREGRVREREALGAYIRRAAHNAVLMAKREKPLETVEGMPDLASVWGDAVKTPLEQYEEDELRRCALVVIEELPTARDRTLVRGFYVDGKSKAELMAELGLAKDQFDKVMSRARARMKELLAARVSAQAGQGTHTPFQAALNIAESAP